MQKIQLNKRTLKIAGIAVGALLLILIAIPLFIDVNSFRPKIESELTNATGRQVTLGKLSLSILSGTVGVEDVSIADDPAFSKSPFITAKSLEVGVEVMPLIFFKAVECDGNRAGGAADHVAQISERQLELLELSAEKVQRSRLSQRRKEAPRRYPSPSWRFTTENWQSGKRTQPPKPQVYDKVNVEMTTSLPPRSFPSN